MQIAKGKALTAAVLLLCCITAIISGCMLVREIGQYAESSNAYDELQAYVNLPERTEETSSMTDTAEKIPEPEVPGFSLPSVDFTALRETGPDIIAWLTLENTELNYPVTQADDNDYYLRRLYNGKYNSAGCLFADCKNAADFSDRNTVIYGHNMRNGTMFSALNSYADQGYFANHPVLFLMTPDGGYVVEVFSSFAAKPDEIDSDASPWRLNFTDNVVYANWLDAMAARSVIQSSVTVTSDDQVLTLSTCLNGNSGKRFIIMGKLTAINETE